MPEMLSATATFLTPCSPTESASGIENWCNVLILYLFLFYLS